MRTGEPGNRPFERLRQDADTRARGRNGRSGVTYRDFWVVRKGLGRLGRSKCSIPDSLVGTCSSL